ncbi:hypothetical protein HDK77DRAFT_507294 [Phyllosticta capitalensis]
MCRYRYMYYSGCCHAKLTLYEYCDDAYNAASLPTAPEGGCAEGGEDAHDHPVNAESDPSPHLTECPSRQDPQNKGTAEANPQPDAQLGPTPPPRQTYASIARSAAAHRKTKSATNLAAIGRSDDLMPPPPKPAGRGRVDHGVGSAGGRRFSENTNSLSGSVAPRGRGTLKSSLPGEAIEACAFDLNLRSPADFPDLSLRASPGLSSASLFSEPNSRSGSVASWAQVARLTSAVQPTHGSTSGNTVADSDFGTASATSLSSFQPEDFDGSFTETSMAPPGKNTAPALRGKKLPPLTTTGLSGIPQNTRKTLPSEWLGNVPTGISSDAMRRKSVPALRTAATSSKTPSSPTKSTSSASPTKSPTKSSTKSPTKVVPFRLETARRAKEREVKEKSSCELLKGKGRKTTKDSIDGPSSPGGIPTSTAAAKQSPLSIQTYYGYSIDDHTSTPASAPHSRIPRLCNKFRNQESLLSTHSELNAAIEHHEHSQAQPPQLDTRADQGHQSLAQMPTNTEQRRPSPTVQHIEDISLHTGSGPRSDDFINVGTARTEMMRSDEAIDKAETALGDIKRRMVSDSSATSEESTVILIDAVEAEKPRASASRTRLGTYPGATPPLNTTQQHIFPRERSSGPDERSLVPHLRVTSNAGTDAVVTPKEPDDIVSPSQGTHWSTHYAQDLGRTVAPSTAKVQHRRIMSAPRVVHADPRIMRVGPDVAKMSKEAVELLRELKSEPQREEASRLLQERQREEAQRLLQKQQREAASRLLQEQQSQAKMTAVSLNAQAKEFVPKSLAQTHQTSGPFVITPNPGTSFPRPQLPPSWSNPTWVNAIHAPVFKPGSSAQVTATSGNTKSPDPPAAEKRDKDEAPTPTGKKTKEKVKDKKKPLKGKNTANKKQGSRVVSTATTASSAGATNPGKDGTASPQHSATGSSTRASTPRLPPSSGYTTPGSSAAALEDSTVAGAGATTAAPTGPYAFRWESMRPSVFNLTTYHADETNHHHGAANNSTININHTYARAPPSSPLLTNNTTASRHSNGGATTSSTTTTATLPSSKWADHRFPSPSLRHHRSCSPATPRPFYACAGGWRSVGGGPLRFESFGDLRAKMLGPSPSPNNLWRGSHLRGGNGGAGVEGVVNGGSKTWSAGRGDRQRMTQQRQQVDWSALGPCGSVRVAEAYEVLPHCPVAVCPECLPDQKA